MAIAAYYNPTSFPKELLRIPTSTPQQLLLNQGEKKKTVFPSLHKHPDVIDPHQTSLGNSKGMWKFTF